MPRKSKKTVVAETIVETAPEITTHTAADYEAAAPLEPMEAFQEYVETHEAALFADPSYNEPDRDEPEHDTGLELSEPMTAEALIEHIETLVPNEPTAEQIADALSEIDGEMEFATTAGVVDHETQMGSWTPSETAVELKAERELEEAVAFEQGVEPEVTLDNLRAGVADREADIMVWNIRNQLDEREAFEIEKADKAEIETGARPNLNILSTLKKVRTQMVTRRAASLFCALNVDPALMNRTIHTGARYNVYAIGKLSDVVYGVTDGVIANAINVACMKSLFAFSRAGVAFTMEAAKGACSKQYALKKLDHAVRQHLLSHTVSESTAPTQASSTMQALVTLGMVSTNGSGKNPVYTLNEKAPITMKVRELLAA